MWIRLRRTGGVAGIVTEATLDTADLDPGEARSVLAALADANLDARTAAAPPPPGPPRHVPLRPRGPPGIGDADGRAVRARHPGDAAAARRRARPPGGAGPPVMRAPSARHRILPPYLLHRMVEEGDAEVRAAALATLRIDARVRIARAESAARRGVQPREPITFARIGGSPQRTIYDQDHSTSPRRPARSSRAEGQDPVADTRGQPGLRRPRRHLRCTTGSCSCATRSTARACRSLGLRPLRDELRQRVLGQRRPHVLRRRRRRRSSPRRRRAST